MSNQASSNPRRNAQAHEVSLSQIYGDLTQGRAVPLEASEQMLGLIISDNELYIPLASVQEVSLLPAVAFVPGVAPCIDGVVNVRGHLIPAINMRQIMGAHLGSRTPACRLVVINEDSVWFGMIVDGITGVVALGPDDIVPQPAGAGPGIHLTPRVSKHDARIKGILDSKRVLKHLTGAQFV